MIPHDVGCFSLIVVLKWCIFKFKSRRFSQTSLHEEEYAYENNSAQYSLTYKLSPIGLLALEIFIVNGRGIGL